jgi:two-component system sensor histidine kinase CreC
MSRRTRIFLGIFVVYLAAVAVVLYRVTADLDPRYRESAEETLVDTAQLLATLLERNTFNGVIPTDDLERTLKHLAQRPVYAKIFGIEKTKVDLHVYVTDRNGFVLFDSRGVDTGEYLAWRDVHLTLQGEYGARTTLENPNDPRSAVMYVGAAIRERQAQRQGQPPGEQPGERKGDATAGGKPQADEIVGMVAVGKRISDFNPFIQNAREKILLVGVISTAAFALLLLIATVWLVRPFGLVADLWRAVRREGGSPLAMGRRLAQALRAAFAETRDTLAGRSYSDEYVQTIAHELKSPLAAIRGAAELLREPMPEDARARFAGNIEDQVARSQALIERLLELSALERRGALTRVEPLSLAALARQAQDEVLPFALQRQVTIEATLDDGLQVVGDSFLLQRAIANLLRNAVEFSPAGSQVTLVVDDQRDDARLSVRDRGPGLPEYARDRIFDKFYSLPRPDTGKKGTGLGLAFVKEVAGLHGGQIRLANHADGGALATLTLPKRVSKWSP